MDTQEAPETGLAPGVAGTVLVVDDDPFDQHILRRVLESHGYAVQLASDAESACRQAAAGRPDLIILDIDLPGLDGYGACRRLKAEESTREIPVVFISGAGDVAAKVQAFRAGGVDYITKPFHAEEVAVRVASQLALHGQQRRLETRLRQRTSVLALANAHLEREIADRRQAEERFRAMLEAAPDAMVIVNEGRQIVLVNSQAEILFGYERGEMLGQPVEFLMPERSREAHADLGDSYITAPKPRAMGKNRDMCGRRRDGSEFPVEVSLSPLYTAGSRLVISAIRDITVRRQAEAVLREREARISRLVEANIVGVIFWRFDGTITEANDAFLRLVGYHRADLAEGKISWDALTPLEFAEATSRAMTEVREDGVCTPYEKEYFRIDGSRVPVLLGSALLADSRDHGVSFVVDLSDTKRVERELLASQEHLRNLATHRDRVKEEERKRIAGEIHDELGSLLTALKMDISLLRMQLGEDSGALERLGTMRELVERTIHMVRQVATRLRPAALNLGLVPALEWLVEDFQRRTGVVCHLDADAEVDLDDAQATAIFRIVQESLTNVTRHAEAGQVDVALCCTGGGMELAVADDGRGFDPETVGNGSFGLFGIRERAQNLGGHARVASAPGQGSRVSIWIPLPAQCPEAAV